MQADRLASDIDQEEFCVTLRDIFDIMVNNQARNDVFLEYVSI